jgi:hypothetical protein
MIELMSRSLISIPGEPVIARNFLDAPMIGIEVST